MGLDGSGVALARVATRGLFTTILEDLRNDPDATVILPSVEWFNAGLNLYQERKDKNWSLTDCISFEVMRRHGIEEALTGDRHFVQAGFKALLLDGGY